MYKQNITFYINTFIDLFIDFIDLFTDLRFYFNTNSERFKSIEVNFIFYTNTFY